MSASNSLYRKPMTPGYLGTYNWRSTLLGLLLFIATNIIATQHIATCVRLQEDHFAQYAIDRVRPPVKRAHGDASKMLPRAINRPSSCQSPFENSFNCHRLAIYLYTT